MRIVVKIKNIIDGKLLLSHKFILKASLTLQEHYLAFVSIY